MSELPEYDSRPYVRLSHSMPEHPKIVGLTDAAFRAWIEAICFCSRQETDGAIPGPMMRRIAPPKVIKELVAAGLLDGRDGGYEVHDYLRHQRSRDEIRTIRQARVEGGSKGAHIRWHVARRRRDDDCDYCLKGVPGGA